MFHPFLSAGSPSFEAPIQTTRRIRYTRDGRAARGIGESELCASSYRWVRADRCSFILKQSGAYCAKFPDIPAPIDRIATEVEFYRIARRSERLAAGMPEILAFSPVQHVAKTASTSSP